MFGRVLPGSQSRTESRHAWAQRQLRMESLEGRQLMSVVPLTLASALQQPAAIVATPKAPPPACRALCAQQPARDARHERIRRFGVEGQLWQRTRIQRANGNVADTPELENDRPGRSQRDRLPRDGLAADAHLLLPRRRMEPFPNLRFQQHGYGTDQARIPSA